MSETNKAGTQPACDHNEMVATGDKEHAWKCSKCGYVYGENKAEATVEQAGESAKARGPVLLSREHDVSAFASSDQTRYVINGIHYNREAGCVEATDGRQLIRVLVSTDDNGEFPTVTGADKAGELPDCILPAGALTKALRNAPNGKSLPILQHVAVTPAPDGRVRLTTNDLDTEQSAMVKVVEGNYPKCEQVIPDWPATVTIALSADLLGTICSYVSKHGASATHAIKIELKDSDSPIRWSCTTQGGRTVTGVLMPVRLE